MRFFVSSPRVLGLRFGAIFGRRELATLFPLYALLLAASVGAVLFVSDFARYLPH